MRQSLFFVTQLAQMPQIYSLSRRFFLNFRPACSTRPEPTVTGRSGGAARLLALPSVMCWDIKRADNAVNQHIKSSDALKQCIARPAKNRYSVCEGKVQFRRICNPALKNVLTYLGSADLQSAAKESAFPFVVGLQIPRF